MEPKAHRSSSFRPPLWAHSQGAQPLTRACCILSLTHEYSRTQGGRPRTEPRGRGCHRERSSTTCCGQSGRRLCPGPREAWSWPALLNHQAVSPAHTRWLLCVSEQWRKCPAGLAGSNSPSALSISSQGHLAKLPQCCLERTGNDRASNSGFQDSVSFIQRVQLVRLSNLSNL